MNYDIELVNDGRCIRQTTAHDEDEAIQFLQDALQAVQSGGTITIDAWETLADRGR